MSWPDLDTVIYSKLSGTSAITALVSTRIYNLVAPVGTTFPYIVFYMGSGITPNSVPRDALNAIYRIEAVASSRASAYAVAGEIYTALHEVTLTISGWTNYWTVAERLQPLVELEGGTQRYRLVGDFRIKASK